MALPAINYQQFLIQQRKEQICFESCLGLGTAIMAIPFVSVHAAIGLLSSTLVTLVTNTALKVLTFGSQLFVHAECSKQNRTLLSKFRVCLTLHVNRMIKAVETFNVLWLDTNRDTLVHEFGHATAFKALTRGRVKVTLNPFAGGTTRCHIQGATRLGKFLGENLSTGIVAGAGAAFSLAASLGLIAYAHFNKQMRPEWSRYCNWMAVHSVMQHTLYALSAYVMSVPGHDFVILASLGVPPIAAAVAIVALPVLFKTVLMICK